MRKVNFKNESFVFDYLFQKDWVRSLNVFQASLSDFPSTSALNIYV